MLNAEKYRKEILNNYSGFSVIDSHIDDCESILCESCLFSNSKNDDGYLTCINRKVKWLLSEYKEPLKVSKLEYDILLYLYHNTKYRYIARDEGGYLFAYYYPVVKGMENWEGGENYETLDIFVTLFKFVKWEDEEPIEIKDVLDNCEVANDAEE